MEPSFKKRILTAIIGIPVIILVLLSPRAVVTPVVMLVSLVGLYEYYRAVGLLKHKDLCIMGYIASLVISAGTAYTTAAALVLVYVFIVVLFMIMLFSKNGIGLVQVSLLTIGLVYIPYFMSHIIYIRALDHGELYIWLVFIGAFLTDTCSYFVGCLLGKRKLCPTISPKKTVEGAIGGLLGGGISFLLYGLIINNFFSALIDGKQFSLGLLFLMGVVVAVVSEIGDLVASSIKRQYSIKDYGNILPGHGGILDRCDSIIMVAPIIFLFLYSIPILR